MKKKIPDFNKSEMWCVETTLKERYGENKKIEILFADSEIRLSAGDNELVLCPVIFWKVDKVNFIIFKTGLERYKCQFFYKNSEQFGTGIEEYDNISECVTTLLQVQTDHKLN
jgi:hypothetical protein